MPHPMYADPDDEIQLDAAIAQLDQRPIAHAAGNVRKISRSATGFGQPFQLGFVRVDQTRIRRSHLSNLAPVRLKRFEQQQAGRLDPWVADQITVVQGLGFVAQQGTYGRWKSKGKKGPDCRGIVQITVDSTPQYNLESSRKLRPNVSKACIPHAAFGQKANYTPYLMPLDLKPSHCPRTTTSPC